MTHEPGFIFWARHSPWFDEQFLETYLNSRNILTLDIKHLLTSIVQPAGTIRMSLWMGLSVLLKVDSPVFL
jgi:hypothetical protein